MFESVTVSTVVNASESTVWACWTEPDHVTKWNFASDDWETPAAQNDLKVGGRFTYTMAAKDGSMSFDFSGTYTAVEQHKLISYTMDDDRKVTITFEATESGVKVNETFDCETENSVELQREGWQAILDNFKKHAESCA